MSTAKKEWRVFLIILTACIVAYDVIEYLVINCSVAQIFLPVLFLIGFICFTIGKLVERCRYTKELNDMRKRVSENIEHIASLKQIFKL